MKQTLIFLSVAMLLLAGCRTGDVAVNSFNPPREKKGGAADHILLLNVFDVKAEKHRENKEKLFSDLIDGMLTEMKSEIEFRNSTPATVVRGPVILPNDPVSQDSMVRVLMGRHNATHAISINYFNVFFDQTDVEVTYSDSGKEKEASYNIESEIVYSWYAQNESPRREKIKHNRYHSSRHVLSGLLAAGPNIVNNRREATALVRENFSRFLDVYFFRKIPVTRKLFVTEFPEVRKAMATGKADEAFTESAKFVHDGNVIKAAKANYNCAVLALGRNEFTQSRAFLDKSLSLHRLDEAVKMMNEVWEGVIDPDSQQ
jgi:hypothetical protein